MLVNYEEILSLCDDAGLTVREMPLKAHDGLIYGRNVGIRKNIRTHKKKSEICAEELAHSMLTVGNILDQSDENNRRQERIARDRAYDIKIGLEGLVSAYKAGCSDRYEIAEYLDCTVEYLLDAIERYHEKYGLYVKHENYLIYFEPLSIVEIYR